jgi:dipeptidyl aminopeptidase/acylaminoacyl peptidase
MSEQAVLRNWVILCCVIVVSWGTQARADLVDDLARKPDVLSARLSPTGEYLAVMKEEGTKRVVAVFQFPKMKLINVIDFPGRSEVGSYWWVNDERILTSVAVDWDRFEEDVSYGELYAVNANGKKGKYLFGIRGDQSGKAKSRTTTVSTEYASAAFTHPMWHDPDHVLITTYDFNRGFKSATTAAKLNVYSGRVVDRVRAPTADAAMIPDSKGNVRFSYYIDDDQKTIVHYRNPATNDWEVFSKADYGESQIRPFELASDGRIYVYKSVNDGPNGVYLMDLETREFEKVYQNDLVDTKDVMTDWQGNIYGAYSYPDYIEQQIFDQSHPNAILRESLQGVFPGGYAFVNSTTHDFNLSIVRIVQDVRTPEYYLFDRKANEIRMLFDSRPWIDDNQLPEVKPIKFTTRDGLEIHGYFTAPKGVQHKNLPMVVIPHGGPHGPRDEWGYNWEAFVVAGGYAILQVNFRGSGGYGTAFERAGHRQWGKKMQDDLTDATLWAIEEGLADPERICISGWSYGGYATLMGIIREPDMYKCAIAGAGVYDMEVQYDQGDFTTQTRWGKKYLNKVIGPTKEDRYAASPVAYVDRIKTPLLLVHGDEDNRVPIDNAYSLQKAMKKAGKPVPELVLLENEPHGPRDEKNIRLWYRSTIDFLEKYIGPGATPATNQASR